MDRSNEFRENSKFLEILEKYKFILKRATDRYSRNKNRSALYALTNDFNEKCNANLSVKQIQRKLNNFKFRLREKHYRSLRRNEKPRFSTIEQKFLNLWDESECWKKKKLNTEESLDDDSQREVISNNSSSQFIDDASNQINPPNFEQLKFPSHDLKSENDFNATADDCHSIKIEPSSLTETENIWQLDSDTESEMSIHEQKTEDDVYKRQSLEELKREVLISQIKMFKATEAAQRAKERLKLYKLTLLQQRNGSEQK